MQESKRVTEKTGCTSCTKQTISFEVSEFHRETHLLQRDFILSNLFELHSFSVFKCTIQSHIINFQPFLTSFVFSCIYWFFSSYKSVKLKSISNELWKGWKLAWYHHFIHIACARKLRGLRQKQMHFVYKTDNLFQSIRISSGNSSVTKGFHFLDRKSVV